MLTSKYNHQNMKDCSTGKRFLFMVVERFCILLSLLSTHPPWAGRRSSIVLFSTRRPKIKVALSYPAAMWFRTDSSRIPATVTPTSDDRVPLARPLLFLFLPSIIVTDDLSSWKSQRILLASATHYLCTLRDSHCLLRETCVTNEQTIRYKIFF